LLNSEKEILNIKLYKVVEGDFLYDASEKKKDGDFIASTRSFIRHDSNKLASAIMKCIEYE